MHGVGLSTCALCRRGIDRVMRGHPRQSMKIPHLDAMLQSPHSVVDIATLLDVWQHEDLVFTCARPPGMEDAPNLGERIRGALGKKLEELRDVTDMPAREQFGAAHDALFFWIPCTVLGPKTSVEVASPMVLSAHMDAHYVVVRLRLFGFARAHAPAVYIALMAALNGGIKLRNPEAGTHPAPLPTGFGRGDIMARPQSHYQPVTVLSAHPHRFDGALHAWNTGSASRAKIKILSPVVIRNRHDVQKEPASVLHSMVRRAMALAPWFGCMLDVDVAGLRQAVEGLELRERFHNQSWLWFSSREQGVPRHVHGFGGHLVATGQLAPLLPFLQLAPSTHVGGSCAKGFGQVSVVVDP